MREKPGSKENVELGPSRQSMEPVQRQHKRPVVFLDRDGTLNVEAGYLTSLGQLQLLPGASEAVSLLNEAGIAAIVVTNQSGPARGLYSEAHVQNLNARLSALLAANGARLDAVYYCPHHQQGVVLEYAICCSCRKPETGLIEKAFQGFPDLDRELAYVIGDQSTDIVLARNAGLTAILVKTGHGDAVMSGLFQFPVEPDFVAETVMEAVQWILQDLDRRLKPPGDNI